MLALAAYLNAQGCNHLLSAEWLSYAVPPSKAPHSDAETVPPSKPTGAPAAAVDTFRMAPRPSVDPLTAPRCPDLRVPVLTESTDPTWSIATLRSGDRAGRRRVGDVFGTRKVEYIGSHPRDRSPTVWMSDPTGWCRVPMVERRVRSAATTAGTTAGTTGSGSRAAKAPNGPRRSAQRAASSVLGGARLDPRFVGGRIESFAVSGVRPGSLLATFGLVNGDRILSINGIPASKIERLVALYARLSSLEKVTVEIDRGGHRHSMTIRIV